MKNTYNEKIKINLKEPKAFGRYRKEKKKISNINAHFI